MPAIEMVRQVHQTTGLESENVDARQQGAGTKQSPADMPAAGGRVATPDRIPMIQLSPNATHLSTKSGPSHLAIRARVPEVSGKASPACKLGGSTTHRGNHPAAPSPWHLGSGSGSMTARGENLSLSYLTTQTSLSYEFINMHEMLHGVFQHMQSLTSPLVHETPQSSMRHYKHLVDRHIMPDSEVK